MPADSDTEFAAFVHARSAALLRLAVLLTGDRRDGEDLLQTTLVKAYQSWWRLRRPDRAEAYVRRILVTSVISWRRRRPVSGMAAVPGGVWLASWTQGQLLHIDAGTGQITARVRVGRPQDGVYAIAYGAGSLCVTDFQTGALLRLDPATGRLLATIQSPTGWFGDVTAGGGFVWVSQTGHADGSWYRLAKVSPVTDHVVALQAIPGNGGPAGLTIAASAAGVWVNGNGVDSVQAVDPASLRLLGSARTEGDLAASGPAAWALSQGTLNRIDRPWTAVAGSLQLYPNPDNMRPRYGEGQNLGFQTLAAGPARTLWTAGPALYRIDETTMRAQQISRFGAVDNVPVIGQTLWVQTEDQFGYHHYVYQLALHRASSTPAA